MILFNNEWVEDSNFKQHALKNCKPEVVVQPVDSNKFLDMIITNQKQINKDNEFKRQFLDNLLSNYKFK